MGRVPIRQGLFVVSGRGDSEPLKSAVTRAGLAGADGSAAGGRLKRLLLVGMLLVAIGVVLRVCFAPVKRPSAVAQAVANASPEVAELLLEADGAVHQMAERYPDSLDTLDVTAMLHARFGNVDEAIACWKRCLEIAPDFAEAHFRIGLIEHERGENSDASSHFRRATEIDPSLSNYPVHWAKSLTNEGKLEEAARVLRADLARHPDSVASLSILGDTYLQLKQYDKAKQCYEQVVELAPHVTSAHYGLGTACAQLGETEAAKHYLDCFKALKSRDEQAHRNELKTEELGLSRVRQGVAEVLLAAAKGYLAGNDPKTAESLLIRARKLDPALGETWRVLAWLYERQNRIDEALEVTREYAGRDPEDVFAQLSLGQLLARIGRVDEAAAILHATSEMAPNNAAVQATMAEFCLQAERDSPDAARAAQRAAALAPTAHHFFLLALARRACGELESAKEAIDQAIALAPERTEYRDLRDAVRNRQGNE